MELGRIWHHNIRNAFWRAVVLSGNCCGNNNRCCLRTACKKNGNADIKTNLEIANLAIADKIESIPQSFIIKGWNNVKNMFSSDAWATVSIISFAILLVALFLFLRARRMGLRKVGFFVGILALLVFVFSFIFSMEKRNEAMEKNHAIIMMPAVTVKSSPNDGSVDLFVLHEGTKVTLLDEADGWNKVRIANGSEGWLPSDASLAY